MATWGDVRSVVTALPGVSEHQGHGGLEWRAGKALVVWERPLRRADVESLGTGAASGGPVLAAHVPDIGAKEALIADDADVFFSTQHFDGYPAVLVCLDLITVDVLEELIVEAWLDRAPKRMVKEYLANRA